ncbi:OLC1v1037554C1 [Oldenlandia corymbosa var. corymbosa]|uniref:OLC1v1037554C1 n=1 Tax=Oldenlandia corymbosa var. corymbosa TaxID=529605 RepID=A0AAV1CXL1_OLDCO|nr:OLC1v1037554C1 [Oldenlandia corymbosa var. corymbosa]
MMWNLSVPGWLAGLFEKISDVIISGLIAFLPFVDVKRIKPAPANNKGTDDQAVVKTPENQCTEAEVKTPENNNDKSDELIEETTTPEDKVEGGGIIEETPAESKADEEELKTTTPEINNGRVAPEKRREMVLKDEYGQEYGRVLKVLGNGRFEAMCGDGVKRLCCIGQHDEEVCIGAGDIILIRGCKYYSQIDSTADLCFKYTSQEARFLRSYGEFPETIFRHDLEEEEDDEDDDYVMA